MMSSAHQAVNDGGDDHGRLLGARLVLGHTTGVAQAEGLGAFRPTVPHENVSPPRGSTSARFGQLEVTIPTSVRVWQWGSRNSEPWNSEGTGATLLRRLSVQPPGVGDASYLSLLS